MCSVGRVSRTGGRNSVAAWIIGVVCLAVVVTLLVLALPVLPATPGWVRDLFGSEETSEEVVDEPGALANNCRDLYADAQWAGLQWTPESALVPSTDAPQTTVPEVTEALDPQVRVTCDWSSEDGTISTTVAEVGSDAGDIIAAGLPEKGFTCTEITEVADRVRCVRSTDEGALETIEAGSGLWVSSLHEGWTPDQYASRIALRVWAE